MNNLQDRTETPNPSEALAAIEASRRAVHDRVATNGWRYDIAYAAIVAGMISAQAFGSPYNTAGSVAGLCLLLAMFRAETKRTGLRVTGVSPRYARWVAIGMALLLAGVMVGMVALRRSASDAMFPTLLAAAAAFSFAVALVGSRLWRRVYRAEMGAGK